MVKRGIQKEVDEVVEKIEEDINSWPEKEKQWFIPDELEKPYAIEQDCDKKDDKFSIKWEWENTYYGGVRGGILTRNALVYSTPPARGEIIIEADENMPTSRPLLNGNHKDEKQGVD